MADVATIKFGSAANELKPVPTYQRLLTEQDVVERLALHDRPNPVGAVRWLVRKRKLRAVRIGRGVLRFRAADVEAFIREAAEA